VFKLKTIGEAFKKHNTGAVTTLLLALEYQAKRSLVDWCMRRFMVY